MAKQQELQQIGCYIYFNTPYKDECINHVVGHHKIGKQTVKGLALKAPDSEIMAICLNHHTGKYGIHQIGVETWEAKYGSQDVMIKWTKGQIDEISYR